MVPAICCSDGSNRTCRLAATFDRRLWSVRLLVPAGNGPPTIHRAVAKITTGGKPADNDWRPGNALGTVDLDTGQIMRTVRGTGTGVDVTVNEPHPDAGRVVLAV
jgi:hypothetical protein